MQTFGHRPRSASRTFHPATMKIHLKHNEITPARIGTKRNNIGLSSTILSQLLHVPNPNISTTSTSTSSNQDEDPLHLHLQSKISHESSMYTSSLAININDNNLDELFLSPNDMAYVTSKPKYKSNNKYNKTKSLHDKNGMRSIRSTSIIILPKLSYRSKNLYNTDNDDSVSFHLYYLLNLIYYS